MSTFIEAAAVTVPTMLALAGGVTAWHLSVRLGKARDSAELLARQLRATEVSLGEVAGHVIPALRAAAVYPGGGHGVGFTPPLELAGIPVADKVQAVVASVDQALRQVQYDGQIATRQAVSEIQEAADVKAAEARSTADQAAQAAVRAFATSLVGSAARVSQQISEGMRRHADDDAYATLVTIDRLVQQLLLAAQNYVILGGGKLPRRWPETSLTDVIRAAMGHLNGFERITVEESDPPAVVNRAVGPAVHTLAVLLDNALRNSPAPSEVRVRVLSGHHGTTVQIDDRGLGINSETLHDARRLLAGGQLQAVTQLGAHPRTGFAVAAIHSRNYGFSVELESPNVYHGTRAELWLPNALLTTLTQAPAAPAERAPAASEPATTPSGLTVRQRPTATAPQRAAGPAPARPGNLMAAAAWAAGTRRSRQSTTSTEGSS
ncbi:ATP-binding protein [Streptomyces violascens]|uniref:ATP-binding protein n=1 Tax=Streptomyces violascens TaxID=67381 RepID=UPI0016789413|nr:ATP-binding protein [Streptomyces violascens]GGU38336.1 hypothetical protein GCM10010289_69180 [Streptomyces violascens]